MNRVLRSGVALIGIISGVAHAQVYSIDWFTIDTGAIGSAGAFELRQVAGQCDAAQTVSAGAFTLTTGFVFGLGGQLCPADVDNDGNFANGLNPDGGVDINDLLAFLGALEAGDPNADLDDDGIDPQRPDGGVEINDLLFFLSHFEVGC